MVMAEFKDHLEDMDEEIEEFTEDLVDRLEQLFGFEVEVQEVQRDSRHDRYQIKIDRLC